MDPTDYYNIISSTSGDDNPDATHFCNYCYTKLYYRETDKDTGKRVFLCVKCNIEYILANQINQIVRKASRFETPQGPANDVLIALGDNPQQTGIINFLCAT